jgi:DNA-binding response OmpR family regulator
MKKILVIEDDAELAKVYRSRLQAQNFEVEYAPDGQSGYYAIYDSKPDVVLIDLTLPQMDTASLIGKIRAQKKFQKLPMFGLADLAACTNADDVLAAGITNIFNKTDPNALNEIVAALNQLFNPFLKNGTPGGSFTTPTTRAQSPVSADEPLDASATTSLVSPVRPNTEYPSLVEHIATLDKQGEDAKNYCPLHSTFIEEYGSLIHPIRKAFLALSTARTDEEKTTAAEDLSKRLGQFRISALQCEFEGLGMLCTPLEALVKHILGDLERATPGTRQTVANAIDLLAAFHNHTSEIHEFNTLRPTALVVDDETVSRKALTLGLQKGRIQVTAVDTAEAALREAEEKMFDLIFLDVEMPGMNGFALCARIRMLPNHKKTSIIFVSALGDLKTRASSKVSGGNHFINKPVNAHELSVTAWTYLFRNRLKP